MSKFLYHTCLLIKIIEYMKIISSKKFYEEKHRSAYSHDAIDYGFIRKSSAVKERDTC